MVPKSLLFKARQRKSAFLVKVQTFGMVDHSKSLLGGLTWFDVSFLSEFKVNLFQ